MLNLNKPFSVIILLFVTILIFLVIFAAKSNKQTSEFSNITNGEVIEFLATVKGFDNSCTRDLQCRVILENGSVITDVGHVEFRLPIGDSFVGEDNIGEKVWVKAIKINSQSFTLEGDESLYISKEKLNINNLEDQIKLIDEQEIQFCSSNADCIIVPYSSCAGNTKTAINKKYKNLYNYKKEWQVFYNEHTCARIGRSVDDSDIFETVCEESDKVKRCQLKFN